jgi:RNA polymerase sigma-70 factor (ECF subfamily)
MSERSGARPTTRRSRAPSAQRDEGALNELYRRHAGPCLGLACRVLSDRTLGEEVVQEVFVRTWRDPGASTRRGVDAVVPARAGARARGRPAARRVGAPRPRGARGAAEPDVDIDLEREVMQLAEAEAVRRALATLSDGEREAIELAYFGGHTYREVAVSSNSRRAR